MSGNNRMRVVVTGAAVAATLGSGLALAPASEAATTPMKTLAYNNAKAHIGDPYVYGAAGPHRFDCSGLVYWNYTRGKIKTKWEKSHPGKKFPRTAQAQYNYSKKVSKSNRKVGDLVFFYGSGGVYHVGYYAGSGKVLHAPKPGRDVKFEKIWTSSVKYGSIN